MQNTLGTVTKAHQNLEFLHLVKMNQPMRRQINLPETEKAPKDKLK